MAKITGALQMEGRIGEIVIYKDRKGNYIARLAGGISKERFHKDPAFVRSRENSSEFGRASKCSRAIRTGFRNRFPMTNDAVHNELLKRLLAVIGEDPVGRRGERHLTAAALPLLAGTEWNEELPALPVLLPQTDIAPDGITVSMTGNNIPAGASVRLVVLRLERTDEGADTRVAAADEAVYNLDGAFRLHCPLPQAGMWIAGLGYRVPYRKADSLCIIGAGGS